MYRTLGGILVFNAALLLWLLVVAKEKDKAQDGET